MSSTKLKIIIAALGLALIVPATALAAGKKGKKAAKGKAMKGKKDGKAKMMMPQGPPEQMKQTKFFVGRWRCKGKFHGMPGVPAHDYKSTMNVKVELDGQWLAMRWAQKKSKVVKHPYKAMSLLGYDRAFNRFRSTSVDNMGGLSWARSSGWDGDKWVDLGKGRMGKNMFDSRSTITKKGKREISVLSEVKGADGWKTVAEESCKR
ncbi:MAG: DUF1579 family protein [Myxococcales bacterium]|nr:DUF1579 family protein [Myxococcales bacterium]